MWKLLILEWGDSKVFQNVFERAEKKIEKIELACFVFVFLFNLIFVPLFICSTLTILTPLKTLYCVYNGTSLELSIGTMFD